jgi:uncharacterized protein
MTRRRQVSSSLGRKSARAGAFLGRGGGAGELKDLRVIEAELRSDRAIRDQVTRDEVICDAVIRDAVTGDVVARDLVTSESELRAIIGRPLPWFQSKMLTRLDRQCRQFIAQSPFVVVASTGDDGQVDLSPKGDPAGFVQVLNDRTLALPDRPGNRRIDTFRNVLKHAGVGLIFFVPGKGETLRVSGKAVIARDRAIRETMAINGRAPELALVVTIERAFFHCAKCIARSKLWERREASAATLSP